MQYATMTNRDHAGQYSFTAFSNCPVQKQEYRKRNKLHKYVSCFILLYTLAKTYLVSVEAGLLQAIGINSTTTALQRDKKPTLPSLLVKKCTLGCHFQTKTTGLAHWCKLEIEFDMWHKVKIDSSLFTECSTYYALNIQGKPSNLNPAQQNSDFLNLPSFYCIFTIIKTSYSRLCSQPQKQRSDV